MSQVELYLGDCLVEMDRIADHSIDCILADLPYQITALSWDVLIPFVPLWAQYKRVIKPRGAIVLFGAQPFTSALIMSNVEWFKYEWIWNKSRATGHLHCTERPLRKHENIIVFCDRVPTFNPQMTKGRLHSRGGARSRPSQLWGNFSDRRITENSDYYPLSIVEFGVTPVQVHPTQKPVDLLAYLIRTYTNEGELVLDNTMGSGSTGCAALQTGRHFIGIERDETYFNIATKRILEAQRAADGLPKQLVGSAQDYDGMPLFTPR